MASNKNQHFVARCYLRPFTLDEAGLAINLYNLDRRRFVQGAPVKHQCSGNYFYGKDPLLEQAMQITEGAYARVLREIREPGYRLAVGHRTLLKTFWLIQHLRTEAASRRSVEMADAVRSTLDPSNVSFRLEIRDAVQMAMKAVAESMRLVADLKVCLVRNRSDTPFVTSDDPAILANRWHLQSAKAKGRSFGFTASGDLLLLPLTPSVLFVAYDNDVYSIPQKTGWIEIRRDSDADAFNQHQILNCRANIFIKDRIHSALIHEACMRLSPLRPETRHRINYAVFDRREAGFSRYRVVDAAYPRGNEEAIIHMQTVNADPATWPSIISWRHRGAVFSNETGVGYVRRAFSHQANTRPFRKEPTGH